ncbi:hypothetical protein [Streptomyces sp. NRRL S-31]|uniref:hypothetical protein n=1 Tax=Streptomyces sp. NRRL S-31 TaxID=1463898 RepID=UPI000AEC0184|nr:hypothetical protein [Streptomyces sp. NRRL S-31]
MNRSDEPATGTSGRSVPAAGALTAAVAYRAGRSLEHADPHGSLSTPPSGHRPGTGS